MGAEVSYYVIIVDFERDSAVLIVHLISKIVSTKIQYFCWKLFAFVPNFE